METKTCYQCNETKPISKFGKQKNKCNTCGNKVTTAREVNELPDYYIIKLLTKYKKLNRLTINQKQIDDHRSLILLKRKAKNEIGKKFCYKCLVIKDISEFRNSKGSCTICLRLQCQKWKKNNLEKVRILANRSLSKHKSELTDAYISSNIRKNLNQNNGLKLSNKDIPQDFIDLKRKELTLKRKIEDGNKETNTKGS